MANQRFYQFLFSKEAGLTYLDGTITIGATGAVSSFAGKGIYSVTRSTTGIYLLQLNDNYNAFVDFSWYALGGATGSAVNDGSFVTGTQYQITTVGNTAWASAGFPAGFTPAVGSVFVATGAGGAGTGTAKAIGKSGISKIELAQSVSAELQGSTAGQGSAFFLNTYNYSEALANPTSGCILGYSVLLRNSSVTY
jgi:hypothetical protein